MTKVRITAGACAIGVAALLLVPLSGAGAVSNLSSSTGYLWTAQPTAGSVSGYLLRVTIPAVPASPLVEHTWSVPSNHLSSPSPVATNGTNKIFVGNAANVGRYLPTGVWSATARLPVVTCGLSGVAGLSYSTHLGVGYVWAADSNVSGVTRIRASSMACTPKFTGADFVHPFAIASDGTDGIVINSNGTVFEFNATTGAAVHFWPAADFSGPSAVTTVGNIAFITDGTSNAVTHITLNAPPAVPPSISGGSYAFSNPCAITSNGTDVWVLDCGNSTILSGFKDVALFPVVGPTHFTAGRRLYEQTQMLTVLGGWVWARAVKPYRWARVSTTIPTTFNFYT